MKTRLNIRTVLCLATAALLFYCSAALAGSLEPSAGPDNSGSAMYTLDDLYNRLVSGALGTKRTGGFSTPTGPPATTGHTLDEVMAGMPMPDDINGANPSDVQAGKIFWGLRTDGSWGLQTGTMESVCGDGICQSNERCSTCSQDCGLCSPRFIDNNDGTVMDIRTYLIWLKNAGEVMTFFDAKYYCSYLASGQEGLTDGSVAGQWRLPTIDELIEIGFPTLKWSKPGEPFTNVQDNYYWSSTACDPPCFVKSLYMPMLDIKRCSNGYYRFGVWPVRDGYNFPH